MSNCKNRQAFSLLELALVIIIVSLLVAASTSGMEIVRKAQIQSSIKKIFDYKYSYHDFMMTYQAIPGDFDNAHTYFDDGTDAICPESDCSGDGDEILELSGKANSEIFRAWQHLYFAGIVDTKYAGEWNENNSVPSAPLNNANISFDYDSDVAQNILRFGSYLYHEGQYSHGGIISAKEALGLDTKYDDGDPTNGKIVGYNAYYMEESGATESDYCLNEDTANYKTHADTDKACSLGFMLSE